MFKDDKKLHYSSTVTELFHSTCETHQTLQTLIFKQFILGIDCGNQPSVTYVSALNWYCIVIAIIKV